MVGVVGNSVCIQLKSSLFFFSIVLLPWCIMLVMKAHKYIFIKSDQDQIKKK